MAEVQCLSSYLMTHLLISRNPNGDVLESQAAEEECQELENSLPTAAGCLILATAAIVETVFYAALTLLALPLILCSSSAHIFFAKLLESSSFTIFWALASVAMSFYKRNLTTHEFSARFAFQQINPTPISVLRREDGLEHLELTGKIRVDTEMEDRGIALVCELAARLDQRDAIDGESSTYNLFLEFDGRVMPLIVTCAVFEASLLIQQSTDQQLSTLDGLPCYLQAKTLRALMTLSSMSDADNHEIRRSLQSLDAFTRKPQSPDARERFETLRIIAQEEALGGIFNTRCIGKAIRAIETPD
jgi:hypothetical protein